MSRYILTIARYTGLEAVRTRLAWLLVAVLIAVLGLAQFAGDLAVTESAQIRNAVMGGALRLFAVFMIGLFVATSMVREFDDKCVDLLVALPWPRTGYYLGKMLGYALVAMVISITIGAALMLFAPFGQAFIWAASLACELLLIASVSLLCVLTFTHVTVALTVVFAFYLLCRSMDAIQLIGHGELIGSDSLSQVFMVWLVDALALVLPALGRFTSSTWLLYHDAELADLLPIVTQTFIFLAVLAAASLFDLYRKNL
jgi:ABC-type Na+ efflux pump permease subunit